MSVVSKEPRRRRRDKKGEVWWESQREEDELWRTKVKNRRNKTRNGSRLRGVHVGDGARSDQDHLSSPKPRAAAIL